MPLVNTIPALIAILAGGGIFLFSKHLRRFHMLMAFSLVFEGLFLILSNLLFNGSAPFYLPTYLLYAIMMLLSPLFYYLAMRFSLTEKGVQIKDLWLLEIVVAYVCIFLIVALKIPIEEKDQFMAIMQGVLPNTNAISTGTDVMLALDGIGYIFFLIEQLFVQIFCIVKLLKYQKLLETYYANLNQLSFTSIIIVVIVLAVRYIINITNLFVAQTQQPVWISIVQAAVFSIFYLLVALFICKVEFTAEELSLSIESQENRQQPPAAGEIIGERLTRLINERFYLDQNIDLFTLSSKIQVNSKYVADYIRKIYGDSFLVFVNKLRVDYAITLMNDKNSTLQDISEQAGFASISTFYRNFTKIKGVSPSIYRKN